jgi:septum formation protein
MRLILASASPRRQELLAQAGYRFETVPADIDEEAFPRDMSPSDLARRIAIAKAERVADRFPDDVVLAADTIVVFGETVLGKPADPAAAAEMLRLLSGTTHIVITGVSVQQQRSRFAKSVRVMSAVQMRFLTNDEIKAYVAAENWRGKAGGYGIQDKDPFVTRIAGSETNIVGLPMVETIQLLKEAGIGAEGK